MAEDVKVTDLKFRPNKVVKAIVLIVLSGLFFGYIGYVYGMGASTKSEDLAVATATPTINVSSTAIASTTATDETADWKTYTNPVYNLSFKYPSYMTVNDNLSKDSMSTNNNLTLTDNKATLTLWVNPDGFGIEDTNFDYSPQLDGSQLTIIDYNAIDELITNSTAVGQAVGPKETEVGKFGLSVGENEYIISTRGSNEYRRALYDIVASFQFTK